MQLSEYQVKAGMFAHYPNQGFNLTYPVLGLLEEAGELAASLKSLIAEHRCNLTKAKKDEMVFGIGDVLWYLSQIARELNVDLDHVAKRNLDKLGRRGVEGCELPK